MSALYVLPPLDEEVRWILGQPNFACAGIANVLRQMGYVIERRAEHEQAAAIHWMLTIYCEHGGAWREVAGRRLCAARQLLGQEMRSE